MGLLCLFILITYFLQASFWHQENLFSTGLRQKLFNPQHQKGQCCSHVSEAHSHWTFCCPALPFCPGSAAVETACCTYSHTTAGYLTEQSLYPLAHRCKTGWHSLRSKTSSVLIRSSSRVSGNWVSGSPRSCSDRERSMKNTRMAWREQRAEESGVLGVFWRGALHESIAW